ncbi:MAG: glycosyltransferase family 2 protein [Cyanophyceae cyanobacterium]
MLDQQSDSSPTLLVVIVNYRTPALTIDCLHSLTSEVEKLPTLRVFVVDNASGDRSVEQIQSAIEEQGWTWAAVIPSERNGGYAFGNNLAIRPALTQHPPRYFLLLNPDTVVRSGALRVLVDFMDEHPAVGIAGSRLEDPDGTPQYSAFRFHTVFSELDAGLRLGLVSKLLTSWTVAPPISDVPVQTDWVAGASMIVRRQVFEQVGLLDEDFFMYYEEVDFCLQARRAGWSCWYVPESRVVHLVGQSSGVTNTKVPPKRRPQYWFDSRHRYFLKNHGRLYTSLADSLWLTGFLLWKIRRGIQGQPNTDPPYLLQDFWRNSVRIKAAATKLRQN